MWLFIWIFLHFNIHTLIVANFFVFLLVIISFFFGFFLFFGFFFLNSELAMNACAQKRKAYAEAVRA